MQILSRQLGLVVAIAVVMAGHPVRAQVDVDPALASYVSVPGISGSLKIIGSDTMNNLMALWSEGFTSVYPNVSIEIEGMGSGTAPPALILGTADFGTMSRPMKEDEIKAFEDKFGYKPTEVATCLSMLAVYVHPDNPLEALTLAQVDAIYSKSRKRGYPQEIGTWGDAGIKSAAFATSRIRLLGRNCVSGAYLKFTENVLLNGDFKVNVIEQPGSSTISKGVASDKFAIGYGYFGIGIKSADVRAIALAADDKSQPIPAEPKYVYTGEYPLADRLYIYLNVRPDDELDPLRREFIRYVFSRQGQVVVVKDGYLPVTASMALKELARIRVAEEPADGD
jgi:phosphate transport system substrate-binding protein